MPRRLSAVLATVAVTAAGLALVAGPATAAPAPRTPDYYPSGPQTDVPAATVTSGGWTQCYLDTYADALSVGPDGLSACSGSYLMLAARASGSDTLSLLAAAPREDVLHDTGDQDFDTSHLANGSQWYFATDWSWGFADAGDSVTKNSCDYASGPLRLCWHTGGQYGGYRIGDNVALNISHDYERVVYQSDGLTAQAITFGTTAPATAYVGRSYAPTATSGSGNDVVLSSTTPSVCTEDQGTFTFIAEGTCTVAADQGGDTTYAAAPRVTQSIAVQKIPATVTVLPDADVVSGQATSLFAKLTKPSDAPGDLPAGAVQFAVDGRALGVPVPVDTSSNAGRFARASSRSFSPRAGDHPVTATFVPTDATAFAGSTSTGTLGVAKAVTATSVAVTARQLVATSSSRTAGTTAPGGSVLFRVAGVEVGRAAVTNGKAVLDHVVAAGQRNAVSAEYLGDDETLGSTDSVTRDDPFLSARPTSTTPRSAAGWWRTPVRIDYTCGPNGAALVGHCPAADVFAGEGAGQSVTRAVSAADGGLRSVTSTVDVDMTAPKAALKGVRSGGRYFAKAPATRCVASDALSGLKSCSVSTVKGRNGARTTTATATDLAGNVTRTSTSYVVVRYAVAGAKYVDGAYVIRKGTGINVQAQTSGRPVYRIASATPRELRAARSRQMTRTGNNTWVYGATVNMPRTANHTWYLGIDHGRSITAIKVRMVG